MPVAINHLDTTPGSVSAAQISGLHRAAARRMRKGEDLHEIVRYLAWERFEVESLKDLSKQQASELLGVMGVKPLTPYAKQKTRGPAPGVIRLMAPWHAGHIHKLATQLGWTRRDLSVWLQARYRVGNPEDLKTARDAGAVIQALRLKLEAVTPIWSRAHG